MKTTTRSIMALLCGCSLWLTGCLDELQQDTGALVESVSNLEKNTASMAKSMEGINQTAQEGMSSMDKRIQAFETVFQSAVEQLSLMADTVAKLDRLLEMIVYVEKMAASLDGMGESIEKLEVLTIIAQELAEKLGVSLEDYFPEQDTSPDQDNDPQTIEEIQDDLDSEYDDV